MGVSTGELVRIRQLIFSGGEQMDKGIKSIPLLCHMMLVIFTLGCSPEIGSQEWCTNMKEKSKGN